MIPERKDPYARIIEQFLRNVEGTGVANEQRFVRQREDRLLEEGRAYEGEVREEQQDYETAIREEQRAYDQQVRAQEFAQEESVEARRRQNALTDSANAIRQERANEIRQSLAYLDPGSDEFQRAQGVLNVLLQPTALSGQEAFEAALSGQVVLPSGERANIHSLSASYMKLAADAQSDEAVLDQTRQFWLEHMSNGAIPIEQRAATFDQIKSSGLFTDETQDAMMSLIGINDPATQEAIRLGNQQAKENVTATQVQTGLMKTQALREALAASHDDDMFLLEIDERNERIEASRAQRNSNRMADFVNFGAVPTDDAAAAALARQFGFPSVEVMQEVGQKRFQTVARAERLQADLLESQVALVGEQINETQLNQRVMDWQFQRQKVWGELEDRTATAANAFAAASQGDIETLKMLQGLQDTEQYADVLSNIHFDTLITRAEDILGSDEERREHERWQRQSELLTGTLVNMGEVGTFVDGLGSQFRFSDYSLDEETGEAPVVQEIRESLDHLSTAQLNAMGVTREELEERVYEAALRDQVLMERSTASAALEALQEVVPHAEPDEDGNIPTTRSAEQRRWRSTFLLKAEEAGLDLDVAEQIADGLLSGSNMDFWRATLDGEEIQSRISLNNANARIARAQAGELEAEAESEGVLVTQEIFDSNMNAFQAMIDTLQKKTSSSYCTIASPTGTGRDFGGPNQEECEGYEREVDFWKEQIENITSAYNTGDPFSFGVVNQALSTDPVAAARGVQALGEMDDVLTSDLNRLRNEAPAMYDSIVLDVGKGFVTSAEEINELITDGISQLPRTEGGRFTSVEAIDMDSPEWRGLSDSQRVNAIASTEEFQDLVTRVANGDELSEDEMKAAARQFGFTHAPGVFRDDGGIGVNIGHAPNPDALRPILDRAVEEYKKGGSRTGVTVENLVEPDDPQQASGVAPSLVDAMFQQESGGRHLRPDGSMVTNPASGAFGIAQAMPLTAWRPGFRGVDPLIVPEPEDQARLEALNSQRRAAPLGSQERADHTADMEEILAPYVAQVDEASSRRFGEQYLTAMLERYNGDVEKALAAYNAGPGNVDTAVATGGEDWKQHLPRGEETLPYIRNIMALANLVPPHPERGR